MEWYYVLNGASLGPVTEMELRRLEQLKTIAADTPVWKAGMGEWISFEKALLRTDDPVGGIRTCAICSQAFPADEMLQFESESVCAACKPIFFQRMKEGVGSGALRYASWSRRIPALLVDLFFISICFAFAGMPYVMTKTWAVGGHGNHETLGDKVWFVPLMTLFLYAVPPLYEIFFIGKYGATPGKMLMGIKVVTGEGEPMTYARAVGRFFSKLLTFYIGFIIAYGDEKRQAMHDHICNTVVAVR